MTSHLFPGRKTTLPESIALDLVHLLLCEDTDENPKPVAETIAALFEFTGNCQVTLGLVCAELQKFADARFIDDETINLYVETRYTPGEFVDRLTSAPSLSANPALTPTPAP